MLRKCWYLNLFLCLILIRCESKISHQDIMNNINKYVKILNTNLHNKQYQKVVQIDYGDKHTSPYNVIIYNDTKEESSVDRTYALYTAINCKSAIWFVRKINDFTNEVSISDPKTYGNFDDESAFNKKLKHFTHDIRKTVERFTSILTYFHEIISDSSFYMDIGVLKAIMSLNMKIDLMSSRNNDHKTHFNKSEKEIVELLIVEMIELQRFLSVYCEYNISNNTKITELFHVWVFDDGDNSNDVNINTFLSILSNIGLESNNSLENCSAGQILLENIIKICDHDLLSNMISKVTFDKDREDDKTIKLSQIVDHMVISYDINIIWWYHDLILTTIMKLLCHFALEITQEQFLSDQAILKINDLNNKIHGNYVILPDYFIEGFNSLKNVNKNNNQKLSSYSDSLYNVHINISLTEDNISIENVTVCFDQLLNRILHYFDHIICAQKYLKFLRKENDKYYTPGSHNKNTLLSNYTIEEEYKYYNRNIRPTACSLVLNLNIISIHSYMCLNEGQETIINTFNTISNICVLVIQHETNNWNLIKTAYNIATFLKNQRFDYNGEEEILFLLKRILNIIITELNTYRIKYCRNLLILGVKFKGAHLFHRLMQIFFYERYGTTLSVDVSQLDKIIDPKYVQYFQIDYLYKHFVENSQIIQSYKDVIQVYWNRRLQSIQNIFTNLREMTFNPQNMYSLYDIFNKFYLAVIFYEVTRQVVGDYDSTMKNLEKLKTKFDFEKCDDAFPDDLISFKTDLKNIFYLTDIKDEEKSVLHKRISEAADKFKTFNFEINYNALHSSKLSVSFRMNDTFNTLLFDEVDAFVRNFNKEFRQLKRF